MTKGKTEAKTPEKTNNAPNTNTPATPNTPATSNTPTTATTSPSYAGTAMALPLLAYGMHRPYYNSKNATANETNPMNMTASEINAMNLTANMTMANTTMPMSSSNTTKVDEKLMQPETESEKKRGIKEFLKKYIVLIIMLLAIVGLCFKEVRRRKKQEVKENEDIAMAQQPPSYQQSLATHGNL